MKFNFKKIVASSLTGFAILAAFAPVSNAVYELGKKGEHSITKSLVSLGFREPHNFPKLEEGEVVVCGYDQGLGERLIVCENFDDMKQLFASYAS